MAAGQHFSCALWPGPRDIWEFPWPLCCPRSAKPKQAVPFPAGLLLPALGNTQLLLGKLARRRESRKAVPLPGNALGQLLTQQHFRAVLTPLFLGVSLPPPALLWVVIPGKHPRDTFNHAFIH